MKTKDLKVGGIYHDGKFGVRELVSLEGADVNYKLLSAKTRQAGLIAKASAAR